MSKNMIIATVTVVVLLILGLSSMFIVEQGEFKVVLKFGEAVRTELEPGIKFKIPFIEKVTSYPKRKMVYDSKSTSILTLDKKPILVDNYTIWSIVEPQLFIKTARTVQNAQLLIENSVYSTVRRKLSEIEYGQIISESTARGNLNQDITTDVAGLMKSNYGILISDIRIKRTDLPEENKASVFNRMISDRQAIVASYLSEGDEESRKITSNADRQAVELLAEAESNSKKIIAEGEQEAARTYNTAYGKDPKFYNLYRTLDSYVTSFNNEPVIMMPIDSPYARILLGQNVE
jgi:membrane protease subunit HflC